MQKTQNYNLNKPELTDPVRVDDFNENAEIIDAALAALSAAANAERVVSGSYVGNNTKNRTIELPFTPILVIQFGSINSGSAMTVATADTEFYVTASSGGGSGDNTRVVENGFQVGRTFAAWHNLSGYTEYYVAIR